MKAIPSARAIALAVFLLAVLPLGQIFQSLVLGADSLSSGFAFWLDAQRLVVAGSFASLVLSLIAPSAFCVRPKKRTTSGLCVLGLAVFLLGLLLSTDFGLRFLPEHWLSISGLLPVTFLFASGFFLALPVAYDVEEPVGPKVVLLFALLGYLSLSLFNRCSGGLFDSVGPLFWIAVSLVLCILVVCVTLKEGRPTLFESSLLADDGGLFERGNFADRSKIVAGDGLEGRLDGCEEGTVQVPEEELSAYGLSDREQEAMRLMLGGHSSESSAELMGVKPATVRTYLQRSYRKMGVASAEEARLLLLPSDGGDEKNPCDEDGQGLLEGDGESGQERSCPFAPAGRFGPLVVALPLMMLLLLAVPHEQFFAPESWYYSEIFALFLGLGLMVAGLWFLCFGTSLHLLGRRRALYRLLLVALVFVGLALVALPVWRNLLPVGGRGLLLGMLLCFASCGLSLASVGLDDFWDSSRADGEAVESDIPLFLFAVVLGFVFEDTWRAATDDFTWLLQLVFLSVLLAYCLVVSKRRLQLVLCYVALAVCAIGVGFGVRAVFVGLLSFSFALLVLNGGVKRKRKVGVALVGFGGSLVTFRLLFDYWWDIVGQGAVSASVHGGQWLLSAMMPAAELLLLAVGLVSFAIMVKQRFSFVCEGSWEEKGSLIALYLRSRGLASLEVETVSGVLQGKTSA